MSVQSIRTMSVAAALALSAILCSCSVKEDRSGCPCYVCLSVDDFIKKSQFSYYTRKALERDYRKVSRFAKEEGLTAHARAVDIRFEKEGEA